MFGYVSRTTILVAALLFCVGGGCRDSAQQGNFKHSEVPAESELSSGGPIRLISQHLPNPIQIHPRVISGGAPEGDAAFQELADLGVRTIISVDGMSPDVQTARAYGMRYVHLPHGYDGIPEQRVMELAKAVRDLEGPIYFHCHHGEHRSPAAASVACVTAGLIPSNQAIPILELAGTNPNYRGLFESVRNATIVESAVLDEFQAEFKEIQDIPPMADAMVQLTHVRDQLAEVAAAGWRTPTDHPDLDPAHEALLIREKFSELLRTEVVAQQPLDFRNWLRDSEAAALELERELEGWQSENGSLSQLERFTQLANRISSNCKACHLKYRDIPLSEKRTN